MLKVLNIDLEFLIIVQSNKPLKTESFASSLGRSVAWFYSMSSNTFSYLSEILKYAETIQCKYTLCSELLYTVCMMLLISFREAIRRHSETIFDRRYIASQMFLTLFWFLIKNYISYKHFHEIIWKLLTISDALVGVCPLFKGVHSVHQIRICQRGLSKDWRFSLQKVFRQISVKIDRSGGVPFLVNKEWYSHFTMSVCD